MIRSRYSKKKKQNVNAQDDFITTERSDRPLYYVIYDYETYGLKTNDNAITQVGLIKLDRNLQKIPNSEHNLIIKPNFDRFISIGSSLVTGMDLMTVYNNGVMTELELAHTLLHHFTAAKNTCVLGFNNISFDDKVTENLFYRNFINPYGWRSSNFNSRIDLLPMLVAYHTLCPTIFNWPVNPETGAFSYKLEHFSAANGFTHTNAHDALSDVVACVDLFQRMHDAQVNLEQIPMELKVNATELNVSAKDTFYYLLKFRDKKNVNALFAEMGKSYLIHFTQNRNRHLRGAVPVIILNNFTTKSVKMDTTLLLDLSLEPEHFKEFINYSLEERDAYHQLSFNYRKIIDPVLNVKANAFPLFARPSDCTFNTELNAEEVQQRIQANIAYLNDNVKLFQKFAANCVDDYNDGKYFSKREAPNKHTPSSILKEVDSALAESATTEGKEAEPANARLAKSYKFHEEIFGEGKDPLILPDTKLVSVLSDIFNNKGLFLDGGYGPDPLRLEEYKSLISTNPVFNSLFLLYLGDNFKDHLTPLLHINYVKMKQQRLEYFYEQFQNELVDYRYKFLNKEIDANQINYIKHLTQVSKEYYDHIKSLLAYELDQAGDRLIAADTPIPEPTRSHDEEDHEQVKVNPAIKLELDDIDE